MRTGVKNSTPEHAERVRRWVEVRPRSVRLPAGRDEKHPRKGNRNAWKKETTRV